MREILFRGKRKDNGEWIKGFFAQSGEKTYIIVDNDIMVGYVTMKEVFPDTIGQYTGLTDKNGKKIFEGDIVKNEWCFIKGNSIVRFGEYKSLDSSNDYQCGHLGFYLEHISDFDKRIVRRDIMYFANKCEIIGNIHDNPELVKEVCF